MNTEVYIAPGAYVGGDVTLGKEVGIWYNAVLRGDCGPIRIGDGTNIQDNCTIHTDPGHEVWIEEQVSVGHNVVLHGCHVGAGTVIGMGSVVLNGAEIGKNCMIGAASLVTGGTKILDNSLAYGNPARVVRALTADEISQNRKNAAHYVELRSQAQQQSKKRNDTGAGRRMED